MPIKSPAYTRSVKLVDAAIMQPVDIQAKRKDYRTLQAGTFTASGNTADIDLSDFSAVELVFKVTAVSGTSPTLDLYFEGKFEATGDYKVLASQTGITGTGTWFATVNPLIFRYVRVRWVVGGTSPSFTFTVAAQLMV